MFIFPLLARESGQGKGGTYVEAQGHVSRSMEGIGGLLCGLYILLSLLLARRVGVIVSESEWEVLFHSCALAIEVSLRGLNSWPFV